jgi:hypothetical protein
MTLLALHYVERVKLYFRHGTTTRSGGQGYVWFFFDTRWFEVVLSSTLRHSSSLEAASAQLYIGERSGVGL